MDFRTLMPTLLGLAWLLPLASFALLVLWGRRMGRGGKCAGYLATLAIFCSAVLSFTALAAWLSHHPCLPPAHEAAEHAAQLEPAAPPIEPLSGDWYSLGEFGRLRPASCVMRWRRNHCARAGGALPSQSCPSQSFYAAGAALRKNCPAIAGQGGVRGLAPAFQNGRKVVRSSTFPCFPAAMKSGGKPPHSKGVRST